MAHPLISAADLSRSLEAPNLRIIDCRWYLGEPLAGSAAYGKGHIPNALFADLDTDLSGSAGPGRHPLPTPEAFERTMGAFGVNESTMVVAYDDRGGAIASRLWWMLTDQGHDAAAVLDGGIQAWIAAGGNLVDNEQGFLPQEFHARPWRRVVGQHEVADRGDRMVIDARSSERFRGDEEPVDPKAGHIPGALSLPLSENLNDDLTFRTAAELHKRFSDAGIESGADAISQCGSGVTACHNILAMEIAGIGLPALYVGSWSDWSTSDRPIEIGDGG